MNGADTLTHDPTPVFVRRRPFAHIEDLEVFSSHFPARDCSSLLFLALIVTGTHDFGALAAHF